MISMAKYWWVPLKLTNHQFVFRFNDLLFSRNTVSHVTSRHDLMTLFSLKITCIRSLALPIVPCLAPEYSIGHCGGYFCPYHFWRTSLMLSVVHWDWKRPDWLTVGPAVCSHWWLYQLPSVLNYSVRWGPSQTLSTDAIQYTTRPWSGCFAENHLIWFGWQLDP